MNMHAKPELFAPCFPIFWIKDDSIEVDAVKVSFTLKYGCVEIDCEAQAVKHQLQFSTSNVGAR